MVKESQDLCFESLSIDNIGRSKKRVMDKKMNRPCKLLSMGQELLKENERLKAENTYLKKLQVLVEERVARESGRRHKLSKD